MQRLSVRGHDGQLPAHQHAGVYHRMTVSLEPGARRYADPSNCDLGLTLRMRKQGLPIPALRSLDEFLDRDRGLVRLLPDPKPRTARLKENNDAHDFEDSDSAFYHRLPSAESDAVATDYGTSFPCGIVSGKATSVANERANPSSPGKSVALFMFIC